MKNKIILFCLLIQSLSFSCKAQQYNFKCNGNDLKFGKFAADTMFSYNNRYVKENAVKSIKTSEFPIEIRVFVYSTNNQFINLYEFQANSDTAIITNKKIAITHGDVGLNNYEIVKHGKNSLGENYTVSVANIKHKKESLNSYCEFLDQLIANHLFYIQGSKLGKEVKTSSDYGLNHINENYEIEIKVGDKFRNFEYQSYLDFNDPNTQRGPYMAKLTKLLNRTLNLHVNN